MNNEWIFKNLYSFSTLLWSLLSATEKRKLWYIYSLNHTVTLSDLAWNIPQLFLLLFSPYTLDITTIPTHYPHVCLIFFAYVQINLESVIFFYTVSGEKQSQFRIDVSNMHLFLFNLYSCLDIGYTETAAISWTGERKTKIQKCVSKNCGAANPKQCSAWSGFRNGLYWVLLFWLADSYYLQVVLSSGPTRNSSFIDGSCYYDNNCYLIGVSPTWSNLIDQ